MLIAAFIATVIICTSVGFVLGGSWEYLNRKPETRQSAHPGYIELGGDEYHAVKCTMRSPEDVARRAGI